MRASEDLDEMDVRNGVALELRRDRPREVARLMLDAAIYGGASAYGHPMSGTRETFKDIALGDVQAASLGVNVDVASNEWYLVGQLGAGYIVIGDLRILEQQRASMAHSHQHERRWLWRR